jgi:15-cis-phytoene synthase
MSASATANSSVTSAVSLAASLEHCRRVAGARARNFYYGMRLVPEPRRGAMYALYAWMRQADDLADAAGEVDQKRLALEEFRRQTRLAMADAGALPAGDLWPAFRELAMRYSIPPSYFDDMIDGQLMDQRQAQYQNFDQLYDYCYKVASVVGLCCIQVWGYEGGESTRKLAEWRGIAFQLTNILRDVVEDAQRGRVYLPAEDFGLFEVNPSMFTLGRAGDASAGLRRVAQRAREYYLKSAALDDLVHPEGRPCLWAMTEIYRSLLDQIEPDPTIVLRRRVRLGGLRKAWIALRATMGRSRRHDPAAAEGGKAQG